LLLDVVCGLQEECDTFQCDFDGTDCSYNTSLYKDCSAMKFNILCDVLFNNSVCDQACISGECLYDGWDCEEEPPSAATTPTASSVKPTASVTRAAMPPSVSGMVWIASQSTALHTDESLSQLLFDRTSSSNSG